MKEAEDIVKGQLPDIETVVSITEEGRRVLHALEKANSSDFPREKSQAGKLLPKPKTETRPGPVEGTR